MLPVDAFFLPDPLEESVQESLPDAAALPVAQPAPAGHARAAAHLLREHLPGDAALQDEDDPGQAGAVFDGWAAAFAGPGAVAREQWLDDFPQLVRNKRPSHGAPPVSDYYYLLAYGAPFLLEFLNRLAAILGDEAMDRLQRQVEKEFRRRLGAEAWEAFRSNDTAWRDRECDRIQAEEKGGEETKT